MLHSAQDQIRFSVPLVDPALCEMAQPNDKIEDHSLGTSAISGHSSCSLDYSGSIPDVPLPMTANKNGTDSCEDLDKFSISLAELPIMDLEELSLPEMPLGTFATDWSVLEDDETAGL